jgi:hypothetical protein
MTAPRDHSRRCATRRQLVAWSAHAPGLFLFYGESLPAPLRIPNLVAVVSTLLATVLVGVLAGASHRWLLAGLTWLVGHVAWGTYLAWRLPRRAPPPRRSTPIPLPVFRCDDACRDSRPPPRADPLP